MAFAAKVAPLAPRLPQRLPAFSGAGFPARAHSRRLAGHIAQSSSKDLPAGIVILTENEICKRMERVVGGPFARQATMRFATSKAPIVNWFQSGASAALCSMPNAARASISGGGSPPFSGAGFYASAPSRRRAWNRTANQEPRQPATSEVLIGHHSIRIAMQTKFDLNKWHRASSRLPDDISKDICAHFTPGEKRRALRIGIEQGLISGPWPFVAIFLVFTIPIWAYCILVVVLTVLMEACCYRLGAARMRAFLLSTEHSVAMKYDGRFENGTHERKGLTPEN